LIHCGKVLRAGGPPIQMPET